VICCYDFLLLKLNYHEGLRFTKKTKKGNIDAIFKPVLAFDFTFFTLRTFVVISLLILKNITTKATLHEEHEGKSKNKRFTYLKNAKSSILPLI